MRLSALLLALLLFCTACTPGSCTGCHRLSVRKASRRAGMKRWSILSSGCMAQGQVMMW